MLNQSGSKILPGLVYFLFFALAANIPMWMTAYLCRLVLHGWFSLDCILVGILAVFLPRPVTAALVGLAAIFDISSAVSETYFLSGRGLIENALEVRQFSWDRILPMAVAVALLACCIVAVLKLPRFPRQLNLRLRVMTSFALLAVALVGLQYGEEFSGTGKLLHLTAADVVSRKVMEHHHLVRSGIRYWFGSPSNDDPNVVRRSPEFWKERVHPGASIEVLHQTSSSEKPDVVMVLLESWGLANDEQVRESLVSAYLGPQITSRYQVVQGTVPFWGSTDAGEARELCSSLSLEGNSVAAQDCLPEKLRALGYRTEAVHGMSGYMYDRRNLYPHIGFQEMWFRDAFDRENLSRCPGAFRGTCDDAIAGWIGHRLQEQDPQFIYWVTLGSHLPVPNPPPVTNPAPCNAAPALAQDVAMCAWYQLVFEVHRSVSQIATGPLSRPTVFVVVGDHAPPFSDPDRRNAFSNVVVPYLVLIPRQLVQAPSTQLLASRRPASARPARSLATMGSSPPGADTP